MCAEKHPGFESLPIRHFAKLLAFGIFIFLGTGCGKSDSARGDKALDTAKREFQAAHFDRALAALQKIEKPTAEAGDLRGCILMEQNNFDEALRAFDEAHAVNPALFVCRLHRGDLFLRQFKFADARREYLALLEETNVLISQERLQYGVLVTFLAEQKDEEAKDVLEAIRFPTESASYYYAQAAWSYAHKDRKKGDEWVSKAETIHSPNAISWFARPFFDLGWTRRKPVLSYSTASG